LLCDAIAFCYGPATALKQILEVWRPHVSAITLVATGTTKEYFERTSLVDELIEVDTECPASMRRISSQRWDALISICNPVGFLSLSKLASVSIYWDFLFWMRFQGHAAEFAADFYAVEMYPGCAAAIKKWGREIPGIREFPVLADWLSFTTAPEAGLILVNLGGQRSKLTEPWVNTTYPALIIEQLQEADVATGGSSRFLVTADMATSRRLAADYHKKGWRFVSLSHNEFQSELDRSDRVITHPGLYSPFESIGHGKPTFFLPSSNYTQVLQMRSFRDYGLAPQSIDWCDLLRTDVAFGLAEEEGVRQVLTLIERASKDFVVRRRLRDEFSSWILMGESELKVTASVQRCASAPFFGNYKTSILSLLREVEQRISARQEVQE